MTIVWTSDEAAAATKGINSTSWQATGVSIDTRTLKPGDLFIALRGNALDGHAYAAHALKAGAGAVVVDTLPPDLPANAAVLKVSDTQKALEDLGRFSRARSQAKIIAVTGSVGKTSTKEMLASCLSMLGETFSTQGNLNNHWGAPLSLSRLPPSAIYAVFELGMNHAGEIAPLSRLVQPDISIITTIAPAHLAHFPNIESIAEAKAEIFQGMRPSGVAILNIDGPCFDLLRGAAEKKSLNIWTFGQQNTAKSCLLEYRGTDVDGFVQARIDQRDIHYRLSLPGEHMAMNTLAVLSVIAALGKSIDQVIPALSFLKPVTGRGSRVIINGPKGPFTIIDDSYNASPAAVKAALHTLGHAPGRKIAILGDMLELGDQADNLHADLASSIIRANVDEVHCCGLHMQSLYNILPRNIQGYYASDSYALAKALSTPPRSGDVLLIKGSKGSKMGIVIDALKLFQQAEPVAVY